MFFLATSWGAAKVKRCADSTAREGPLQIRRVGVGGGWTARHLRELELINYLDRTAPVEVHLKVRRTSDDFKAVRKGGKR